MIVAVAYENGQVFQHFGHTGQFTFYHVDNGIVIDSEIIGTSGQGHGLLARFLKDNHVDALICGGIGGGAKTALSDAGIRLYGGISGNADDAVNALLAGNLVYDENVHCDHHDREHGEEKTCGEHGCGNHFCH